MTHRHRFAFVDRITGWDETWALAVVFGVASVPWTYGFVTGGVPLWPSFIASATYYAAGGGREGLVHGAASNVAGIAYAATSLLLVEVVFGGGNVVALSVVVGAFMLLASLHEYVPVLSFTPGGFFGYATMFSVNAAGATAFGVTGVAGETLVTFGAMITGTLIGYTTDVLSGLIE